MKTSLVILGVLLVFLVGSTWSATFHVPKPLTRLHSTKQKHQRPLPHRTLTAQYASKNNLNKFKREYIPTPRDDHDTVIELVVNSTLPSINLDSIPGIVSLICYSNYIELVVDEASDARKLIQAWDPIGSEGILLLLNPHWSCHGIQHASWKILKRIEFNSNYKFIGMRIEPADMSIHGGEFQLTLSDRKTSKQKSSTPKNPYDFRGFEPDPPGFWRRAWLYFKKSWLRLAPTFYTRDEADEFEVHRFNWTALVSYGPNTYKALSISCDDCHMIGFFRPFVYIRGSFSKLNESVISVHSIGSLDMMIRLQFQISNIITLQNFQYNLLHIPLYGVYVPGIFSVGPAIDIRITAAIVTGPQVTFTAGIKLEVPEFQHWTRHPNATAFKMSLTRIPFALKSMSYQLKAKVGIKPVISFGFALFEILPMGISFGFSTYVGNTLEVGNTASNCSGIQYSLVQGTSIVSDMGPVEFTLAVLQQKNIFTKCLPIGKVLIINGTVTRPAVNSTSRFPKFPKWDPMGKKPNSKSKLSLLEIES